MLQYEATHIFVHALKQQETSLTQVKRRLPKVSANHKPFELKAWGWHQMEALCKLSIVIVTAQP